MSKLPHTLDFNRMGLQSLALLDANDAALTGPIARRREYHIIPNSQQFPLMEGWSSHCLKHKLIKPDYTIEKWEQSRWDRDDEQFLRRLGDCTAPEDVEEIMPDKWKPHRSGVESDPRLERVTKLCTTIVNKVVDWTSAANPAWAPKTTAEWNRCQVLQKRIQDMLEFLESTLGEAVGMTALKDPSFIRRCWRAMSEDDHSSFEDSIEQSAAYYYQQAQQNTLNGETNNTNLNGTSQTFEYNPLRQQQQRGNNNNNNNNMMMMMMNNGNQENNTNDDDSNSNGSGFFRSNNARRVVPNPNLDDRSRNTSRASSRNNNENSNNGVAQQQGPGGRRNMSRRI